MKKVRFTFEIEKEGDQYTAFCPELGVPSCGKDIPDAIEMLADAVALYLRIKADLGEEWDETG